MPPLDEKVALDLLRRCFGDSVHEYYWEALADIEWSGEGSVTEILQGERYDVIFDPNPGTISSRLAAARYFGRDDTPLGYRLTRTELLGMSRQSWNADADFYVLGIEGSLCALKTHEDPDSQFGFWIPKRDS